CYGESRPRTMAVAGMLGIHNWAGTWNELVHVYVALTEFGKSKFIQAGLPAEKVVVKPNCLIDDPQRADGRGEHAIFVGRLSEEKGLRSLLHAWARLARIPLIIVGDGPLREVVRRMAARVDDGSVRMHGLQPRETVLRLIREARFLILPS